MTHSTIYLRGLNYRDGDREIEAGYCRELRNLYPSGTPPKLIWTPVPEPVLYYAGPIGTTVRAGAEWQRNNLPPMLVLLRIVPSGNDVIVGLQLDNAGGIVPNLPETILWTLNGSNSNRDAQFAQLGDHLIIAIHTDDRPEELLVASTYEDTTICFPYNIPFSVPPVDITPTDGGSYNWFGVRFAYELFDGSLVRFTPVRFRQYNYSTPKNIQFVVARMVPQGYEAYKKIIAGIAVFLSDPHPGPFSMLDKSIWHRIGMISWKSDTGAILDEIPNLTNGGSGYAIGDVLTVSGGIGATLQVQATIGGGVIDKLVFLTRGRNYSAGPANLTGGTGSGATIAISSVGAGGNMFEFRLSDTEALPLVADLNSYPQLDEDALTAHSVYSSVLGSYNRSLLLGQAEYEFRKPESTLQDPQTPIGKTRPEITSITRTPPLITQETQRLNRICHLTWVKPTAATGVDIEMYLLLRYDRYIVPFGDWQEVQPPILIDYRRIATNQSGTTLDVPVVYPVDVPSQANPTVLRYRNHSLIFRMRAVYADGVPSDWVYQLVDQG